VVFGLAEKRGVGVDIHLHDAGTLGLFEIEEIAARTTALGMQGKVGVSHAYALGDISADTLARAGEMLAASGVAIMSNAPGNHAFPPVAALRKAGVTVFAGSDNIRDSWWPYGDGDMLNRANMIGYRSGFYEDRELEAAWDVASHAGAKALGLEGYGIAVGAKADFVALKAEHVPEAVVAVPRERTVYRGGRAIARDGAMIG
ncbi:MAG: metal-dependent hydrolase, partial [Mesorhizobium sp.]